MYIKLATIEKLNTVIEEATKVLNDTSANKEAVEEAIRALNTAIANLEKYVTEAELDQVIAKGEEFLGKTDIYTKESLDILSTALAKVRSAITSGDKEAIESDYAQLTEAIDKLVKIDAPTPEVKPEVKPENKPNTSVKTGDSTMIAPFVIVASLSLFALVTVIKKKQSNKIITYSLNNYRNIKSKGLLKTFVFLSLIDYKNILKQTAIFFNNKKQLH